MTCMVRVVCRNNYGGTRGLWLCSLENRPARLWSFVDFLIFEFLAGLYQVALEFKRFQLWWLSLITEVPLDRDGSSFEVLS